MWKYNKSSIYTEDDEEEDGDDEEIEDDGNVEEKVNMLRFLLLFVLFCFVLSTFFFFLFCVKAANDTKPFSEEWLKKHPKFRRTLIVTANSNKTNDGCCMVLFQNLSYFKISLPTAARRSSV